MSIEISYKCIYCKRAEVTYLAKIGQLEVNVCNKCGEVLKKTMDAELIEIDPLVKEGKK